MIGLKHAVDTQGLESLVIKVNNNCLFFCKQEMIFTNLSLTSKKLPGPVRNSHEIKLFCLLTLIMYLRTSITSNHTEFYIRSSSPFHGYFLPERTVISLDATIIHQQFQFMKLCINDRNQSTFG